MSAKQINVPVIQKAGSINTYGRSWLGRFCTVKGVRHRVISFNRGVNENGIWLHLADGSRVYKPYREAVKK